MSAMVRLALAGRKLPQRGRKQSPLRMEARKVRRTLHKLIPKHRGLYPQRKSRNLESASFWNGEC